MTMFLPVATGTAAAVILAACAATTPNVTSRPAASAGLAENRGCLTQTGSRIAGNPGDCSAFGRSYSHDDINNTGSTSAADALRLLDPSITVHR
jgi:hypothetical protein